MKQTKHNNLDKILSTNRNSIHIYQKFHEILYSLHITIHKIQHTQSTRY